MTFDDLFKNNSQNNIQNVYRLSVTKTLLILMKTILNI